MKDLSKEKLEKLEEMVGFKLKSARESEGTIYASFMMNADTSTIFGTSFNDFEIYDVSIWPSGTLVCICIDSNKIK